MNAVTKPTRYAAPIRCVSHESFEREATGEVGKRCQSTGEKELQELTVYIEIDQAPHAQAPARSSLGWLRITCRPAPDAAAGRCRSQTPSRQRVAQPRKRHDPPGSRSTCRRSAIPRSGCGSAGSWPRNPARREASITQAPDPRPIRSASVNVGLTASSNQNSHRPAGGPTSPTSGCQRACSTGRRRSFHPWVEGSRTR